MCCNHHTLRSNFYNTYTPNIAPTTQTITQKAVLFLCGRGLSALKISVTMWQNDATVWAQITGPCFKTIDSRSFLTLNHVLWNLFEKEPCDKQDTTELHNA